MAKKASKKAAQKTVDPKVAERNLKARTRAKELRAERKSLKNARESIMEKITIAAMAVTIDPAVIAGFKNELAVLDDQETALVHTKSVWEEMPDGRLIRNIVVDEHYTIEGKIDPANNGVFSGMVSLMYDGTAVLYTSGAHNLSITLQQRFNKIISAYKAIIKLDLTPDGADSTPSA